TDPRLTEEFKDCDICANDIFRDSWKESGVERQAFDAPPAMAGAMAGSAPAAGSNAGATSNLDEERLVKLITDQVMSQLNQ
ncbi:MAG: class II aldolase/adducin family protein, partial [Planctomycetota bacterium]